uniref:Protein kinase domain-containing protein n=1 Tax=Acrobeloides nanus TaxID=290746 RepID=A0A914C5H2_9BILA
MKMENGVLVDEKGALFYLQNLAKLDHENVLKFKICIDAAESSTSIPNSVLMDQCQESLSNYINDSKRYIQRYFYLSWAYGIAAGTCYLHENNIIHRDLKPDKFVLYVVADPDFQLSLTRLKPNQ